VPVSGAVTHIPIIIIQGNLRGSPSSSLSSESAVSPKLAAWGELEFRKGFLILSYIGE
jgi:hypothetical protein